jgi:hypothetical protein
MALYDGRTYYGNGIEPFKTGITAADTAGKNGIVSRNAIHEELSVYQQRSNSNTADKLIKQ